MAGQVKDREAFQRLSFLYQDPENQALARFYCHTERTIAKRLVLRRDPSVKRTLCRGCSSLLIPGLTCTQRQRRECSLLLGNVRGLGEGRASLLPGFKWVPGVGYGGGGFL
uniref:Ribonuclease P/MRP subunit p21 n=1 Tax=Sus scrofa TaxID=9823 RepID=A0ABB5UP45_PIG